MPLLDRHGWKDDIWQGAASAGAAAAAGPRHLLLAWEEAAAGLPQLEEGGRLGLLVPNSIRALDLEPLLPALALVVIPFPAHGDGRGFSLARQLRDAGYQGRLRARGPLIADQFAYALACGFDEIELSEASAARQPLGQWLKAVGAFSSTYQRGYGARANILDQRRAARATGDRPARAGRAKIQGEQLHV